MKILLTNDDGYNAEGIVLMHERLTEAGYDTYIVAPDRQRSGASHSITLFQDLVAERVSKQVYRISGTPADCVIFAISEIANDYDLVISGINAGQNMGEDIFYSGTVAAATEACFLGFPSLAFSMCAFTDINFSTGVDIVLKVISMELHKHLRKNELLNINIPNVPIEEIKGFKTTKIGERKYKNFINYSENSENKWVYRVGGDSPEWVAEEKSDFNAINNNYVSVTHLIRKSDSAVDLTSLEKINNYEI